MSEADSGSSLLPSLSAGNLRDTSAALTEKAREFGHSNVVASALRAEPQNLPSIVVPKRGRRHSSSSQPSPSSFTLTKRYLSGGVHENMNEANDRFHDTLHRIESAEELTQMAEANKTGFAGPGFDKLQSANMKIKHLFGKQGTMGSQAQARQGSIETNPEVLASRIEEFEQTASVCKQGTNKLLSKQSYFYTHGTQALANQQRGKSRSSLESMEGVGSNNSALAVRRGSNHRKSSPEYRRMKERLEQYKYSATILKELPPLTKDTFIPLIDTPIKKKKSTHIIERNASTESLHAHLPFNRMVRHAQTNLLHRSRSQVALRRMSQWEESKHDFGRMKMLKRMERLEEFKKHRKKTACQNANKFARFKQCIQWFKLLSVFFAHARMDRALDEEEERTEVVDLAAIVGAVEAQDPEDRRSSVSSRRRSLKQKMVDTRPEEVKEFEAKMKESDDVRSKLTFLQTYFRNKRRIRTKQENARIICQALLAWKETGPPRYTLNRFSLLMRRIQRWWRRMRTRMLDIRKQVSKRWKHLERDVVTEELDAMAKKMQKDEDKGDDDARTLKKKATFKRMATKQTMELSLQERVDLSMTHDGPRELFCLMELRWRRWDLLPKLEVWESIMEQYEKDVRLWRDEREAALLMGVTNAELENRTPCPMLAAVPSHIPTDDEIVTWIKRCRKNPHKWHQIKTKYSSNDQALDPTTGETVIVQRSPCNSKKATISFQSQTIESNDGGALNSGSTAKVFVTEKSNDEE